MTKAEAIEQLQNCIDLIKQNGQDYLDNRDIPLLDMAIKALKIDLVRCKECRFFKREECRYYIAHGIRRKPNDFCSNGKPKGGEDE